MKTRLAHINFNSVLPSDVYSRNFDDMKLYLVRWEKEEKKQRKNQGKKSVKKKTNYFIIMYNRAYISVAIKNAIGKTIRAVKSIRAAVNE